MGLRRRESARNRSLVKQSQTLVQDVVLTVLILVSVLLPQLPHASAVKIGVMHYGSYTRMGITCQRDELILINSEVLGYSTDPECNPSPMCSVPYTLARWYCRGKSSCSGIPVERRPLHKRTCGSDFTNCLRVEYQCVKRTELVNVCEARQVERSHHGFITSPSFPDMYPPDQDCTCYIQSNEGAPLQLKTVFFLLKANQPCRDYVGVKTDKKHWGNTCGYNAKENIFRGQTIQLDFISDSNSQEMGFWMEYKGTGGSGVSITCGRKGDMLNQHKSGRRGMTTVLDLYKWRNKQMKEMFAKQGLEKSTGKKIFLRNGRPQSSQSMVASLVDSPDYFAEKSSEKEGDDSDADFFTTTKSTFIQDAEFSKTTNQNRNSEPRLKMISRKRKYKPALINAFLLQQRRKQNNRITEAKTSPESDHVRDSNQVSKGFITIEDEYKEASPEDDQLISNIGLHDFNKERKDSGKEPLKFSPKEGTGEDGSYGFQTFPNNKNVKTETAKKDWKLNTFTNQEQNNNRKLYQIYDPKTGKFGWRYKAAKNQRAKPISFEKQKAKKEIVVLNVGTVKSTGPDEAELRKDILIDESKDKDMFTKSSKNTPNEEKKKVILHQDEKAARTIAKDNTDIQMDTHNNNSNSFISDTNTKIKETPIEDNTHEVNEINSGQNKVEDLEVDINLQISTSFKPIMIDTTTPANLLQKSHKNKPMNKQSRLIKDSPQNLRIETDNMKKKSQITEHYDNADSLFLLEDDLGSFKDDQFNISLEDSKSKTEYEAKNIQQNVDIENETTTEAVRADIITEQHKYVNQQDEKFNSTPSDGKLTLHPHHNFSLDSISPNYNTDTKTNLSQSVAESVVDTYYTTTTEPIPLEEQVLDRSKTPESGRLTSKPDNYSPIRKNKTHNQDAPKSSENPYYNNLSNRESDSNKENVVEVFHMGNWHAILDDLPSPVITDRPEDTTIHNVTDMATKHVELAIQTRNYTDLSNKSNSSTKTTSGELTDDQPSTEANQASNQTSQQLDTETKVTTLQSTVTNMVRDNSDTVANHTQEALNPESKTGQHKIKPENQDSDNLTLDESYYLSTTGMIFSSTNNFMEDIPAGIQESSRLNDDYVQGNNINTKGWNTNKKPLLQANKETNHLLIDDSDDMKSTQDILNEIANSEGHSDLIFNAPNNSVLFNYFNKPHKSWQQRYNTWATYYYNLYKAKQNNQTHGFLTPSITTEAPIITEQSTYATTTVNTSSIIDSNSDSNSEVDRSLTASTVRSEVGLPKNIKTAMPETTTPSLSQVIQKSIMNNRKRTDRLPKRKTEEPLPSPQIVDEANTADGTQVNQSALSFINQRSRTYIEKQGADNYITKQEISETDSSLSQNQFAKRLEGDTSDDYINTENEKAKDHFTVDHVEYVPNTIVVDIAQNKQFSKLVQAIASEGTTPSVSSTTTQVSTTVQYETDVVPTSTTPSLTIFDKEPFESKPLPDEELNTTKNTSLIPVHDDNVITMKSSRNISSGMNETSANKKVISGIYNMDQPTDETSFISDFDHQNSSQDYVTIHTLNLEKGTEVNGERDPLNLVANDTNEDYRVITNTYEISNASMLYENDSTTGLSLEKVNSSTAYFDSMNESMFNDSKDLSNYTIEEKQGVDSGLLFINDGDNDTLTLWPQILSTTSATNDTDTLLGEVIPDPNHGGGIKYADTQDKEGKADHMFDNTEKHSSNANEYDHKHWWNQYWQAKWQETWEKYHSKHNRPENATQTQPLKTIWEPSPEEFLKQDFDYQKPIIPPYLGQKDPDNMKAGSKDEQMDRWNKVYGKWFLLDSKQPIEDFVKVINEKWKDKQMSFDTDTGKTENKGHLDNKNAITGDERDAFDYLVSQTGEMGDYYRWGFNPDYDYQEQGLGYGNYLQHQHPYYDHLEMANPGQHYNSIFGNYKEANLSPEGLHPENVNHQNSGLFPGKIGDAVTVWDARFAKNENELQNRETNELLPYETDSTRSHKATLKISENEQFNFNILHPADQIENANIQSKMNPQESFDLHNEIFLGLQDSKPDWGVQISKPAVTDSSLKDLYKEPWDGRSFIWKGPEISEGSEAEKSNSIEDIDMGEDFYEDTGVNNNPQPIEEHFTKPVNRQINSQNDDVWDMRLSKQKNTVLEDPNDAQLNNVGLKTTFETGKIHKNPHNMQIINDGIHIKDRNTQQRNDKLHDYTMNPNYVPIEEYPHEINILPEDKHNKIGLKDDISEPLPWDIRLNRKQDVIDQIPILEEIPLERQDGNLYKHIIEPPEFAMDKHQHNIDNGLQDNNNWFMVDRSTENSEFDNLNQREPYSYKKQEPQKNHDQENTIQKIGPFNEKTRSFEVSANTDQTIQPLIRKNYYHEQTDRHNNKLNLGLSAKESFDSSFKNPKFYKQPLGENKPKIINKFEKFQTDKTIHKPFQPNYHNNDNEQTEDSYSTIHHQSARKQTNFESKELQNPDDRDAFFPNTNELGRTNYQRFEKDENKQTTDTLGKHLSFQNTEYTPKQQDKNEVYINDDAWYRKTSNKDRKETWQENKSREKYHENYAKYNSRENQQETERKQNMLPPRKPMTRNNGRVKTFPPPMTDENPSSWPKSRPFQHQSTEANNWVGKPKFRNINKERKHYIGDIKPMREHEVHVKGRPSSKEYDSITKHPEKARERIPKSHWMKDQVTLPGHRPFATHHQNFKNQITDNSLNGPVGFKGGNKFHQRNGQHQKYYGPHAPRFVNENKRVNLTRNQVVNNAWQHAKSVPDQLDNHLPTMPREPDPQYTAGALPHNMKQRLGDADPTLYGRIQNYLDNQGYNKNRIGSKMAAIEAKPEPTKGVNKDTVWVLLVIAIIGWLIFMVMVGLLVYYKRHRMCHSKVFRGRHGYSSSYGSSMPKHLLFPDLHSPLCTFSHPQGDLTSSSSSAGHSPSIPTRPQSANSNDSLLRIPQYNPHSDPRPTRQKKKSSHMPPAIQQHHHNNQQHSKNNNKGHRQQLNEETFSNHSAYSNGAMSDRPLPPVPLSPASDQGPNRTRSSSMCAEIAFSSNSSTESIGVQEIMGHCDMPGFDTKSIGSRTTPASGKSHYQSLNTIRDRKAKNRCPSPDLNMFTPLHPIDVTDTRNPQCRQVKKPFVSSNVNNWVVQNMPPKGGYNVANSKSGPIDPKSNARPGTPVFKQRQYSNQVPTSTFSTFMPVETHATPYPEPEEIIPIPHIPIAKDKNPPYTNIQEIKASVHDGLSNSIPPSSSVPSSQTTSDFSSPSTSEGHTSSNSDTEHSVQTIPHPYAQTSTPFNERRPSPSASVINSPGEKRMEKDQQQKQQQQPQHPLPPPSQPVEDRQERPGPPEKPHRNGGSKSVRSSTTVASNNSSECTEAIYMSLTKIANKYTGDTSQHNQTFTTVTSSDTFDKNSLISQLDQVSSKNSLISQRGQASSKPKPPLIRQIAETSPASSSASHVDPISAKNSLISHIDQVTANFKPSSNATGSSAKDQTSQPWMDMYQNSQMIKHNASLMSCDSSTSVEQEPSTSSSLSINALKENSHNSSVVSRTIRSPSNDQVYLKTAPHMVQDGIPLSKSSVNGSFELPANNVPSQGGSSVVPLALDITTSSAAVSEISIPVQTKAADALSPNPILMGSQALKSASSMLPSTFAEASMAYKASASKPPSGNHASKPHLGLPGIHHARNHGKMFDAAAQRQMQSLQLASGIHVSNAHGKGPAGQKTRSQMNANAQRIITTLSKTKPGSSAERIKKIIPEQASVFIEKVKPELNRILSQRTARHPVNV